MRRTTWRSVALVVTAALVAASCSTSPVAAKHKKKEAVATSPTGSSGTGNSGTGNSGTGNSGTGNSGSGTTTTEAGGTTTTSDGTTTASDGSTTTSSTTTGTSPRLITKTAKTPHVRSGPVISKFRPASSPTGATVTIVGRRFGHATVVSFDGIVATITFNSPTRIQAVVPPGATSGPIAVVTKYGSATVPGFVVS